MLLLKRKFIIFLSIAICMLSCTRTATVFVNEESGSRIAYQREYSPCGPVNSQIVIDSLNGKLYKVIIDCNISDMGYGLCTYLGIGTQKHVDHYRGKHIIKRLIYRPVYDTNELRKVYAVFNNSVYSELEVLPLQRIDSLLIETAIGYKGDTTCDKKYLQYIKGFVLVKTEDAKIKKEKIKMKR